MFPFLTLPLVFATIAALLPSASANEWGPTFATCTQAKGAWIRWARATVVLPKVPIPAYGSTALSTSLITDMWDFKQALAVHNGRRQDWTIFAQTRPIEEQPSHSPPATYNAKHGKEGDRITMDYKFDDGTGNYTQKVWINDDVVFEGQTTGGGWGECWLISLDCLESNCGVIPEHEWIDIRVGLDRPDYSFNKMPDVLSMDHEPDDLNATMWTRNGVVWNIADIVVPEWITVSSSVWSVIVGEWKRSSSTRRIGCKVWVVARSRA